MPHRKQVCVCLCTVQPLNHFGCRTKWESFRWREPNQRYSYIWIHGKSVSNLCGTSYSINSRFFGAYCRADEMSAVLMHTCFSLEMSAGVGRTLWQMKRYWNELRNMIEVGTLCLYPFMPVCVCVFCGPKSDDEWNLYLISWCRFSHV